MGRRWGLSRGDGLVGGEEIRYGSGRLATRVWEAMVQSACRCGVSRTVDRRKTMLVTSDRYDTMTRFDTNAPDHREPKGTSHLPSPPRSPALNSSFFQ